MFLYGAGGHAKVIMDILKAEGKLVEALIDDNEGVDELMGVKVLHNVNCGISPLIVSIGNNRIRRSIAEKVDAVFGMAVHPSAIVSGSAKVDVGTVVMQGVIIQACVQIGSHCIINTGASIDHECVIDDFVHISPRVTLCGNVHVGEGTWIGAGTVVIPGVKIGKWTVIGAGSVVDKDIPDGVLALGNRCEIVKTL
ncbi:acetyltransferase [Phocaeicola plebeius]